MRMNYIKWILLCMTVASVASAGYFVVPAGPVSGKWVEGDSVIVEPGAYVDSGDELAVERGVHIFFSGYGRFEVEGTLLMEGDTDSPILIYPVEGWRGIRFVNESNWNLLSHVVITDFPGTARQCVEMNGGGLELNHCAFIAGENCLRVNGGQLHARNNLLTTTQLYSRVVEFNNLEGFASPDCDLAPGNIFQSNYLKADVGPLDPDQPIDPFAATIGLWVDYCTNICFSTNDIVVRAPLMVVGARFGRTPDFGAQSWNLDHSIIYAESSTHMAFGVLNEVDGDLDVSKVTITVRGAEGYSSSCFYAARTSYIRVNSTTTMMGSPGDIFFNTNGSGQIDANYLVKWVVAGTEINMAPMPSTTGAEETVYESFDNTSVFVGDSVWNEDPAFEMVGEWGNWENKDEISAFFALRSSSPCIDRGDPELGFDPDNTRLDIGAYYYNQSGSPIGGGPGVVETSQLLPAYPNPFNPTTIIPVEVASPGLLRMTVFDVLGRIVYETATPVYSAGLQNVHFQASALASGTYIAQAELDGLNLGSQRLVLVK